MIEMVVDPLAREFSKADGAVAVLVHRLKGSDDLDLLEWVRVALVLLQLHFHVVVERDPSRREMVRT